jgi:putative transposase
LAEVRARAGKHEPDDHGIGRSRGGLTTKTHAITDGQLRLLTFALTGGNAHDSPMLPVLLEGLSIHRDGPGRPRTRPDHLLADKAYSSKAHRAMLRRRGIAHTIPERDDQKAARARRGPRGGRPPKFDQARYQQRNVVERGFCWFKQWRGLAARTDKLAINYAGGITLKATLEWLP